MECFCGCGTKLRRNQHGLSIQVGTIALELLAWDKARALWEFDPVDPADAGEINRLVDRGAELYQRLLLQLHESESPFALDEGEAWLANAEAMRRDRPSMTEVRWLTLSRTEPLLDDGDIARLDRAHPERSYSRQRRTSIRRPPSG